MKKFNIRVYGVCINERNEVLLSKERYKEMSFTKFPGGGLEWGEGTRDCLKREFQEEFALTIEVGEVIYLTDFFQVSAFSESDQVISIYYRIFAETTKIDKIINQSNGREALTWIHRSHLNEEHVYFPIDKIVVNELIN